MMNAKEAKELVAQHAREQEAKKFAEADKYIEEIVAPVVEREAKKGETKAVFDPPHKIKAIVAKKLEELGYQILPRDCCLVIAW